jgi:hypothetical protein
MRNSNRSVERDIYITEKRALCVLPGNKYILFGLFRK